jgi:capsular exopolysaccharide synthesis family protein
MSKERSVNREEGVIESALRILRRRKWIVLEAIIVVPLLAFLFTQTQEKEYTASSTLLFRETPAVLGESPSVVDPTREAATNGELVALPVVAEEAEKQTAGKLTAGEILGAIEVSPSANADTVRISATTPDPELSAEIANAYGEAYIEFRRSSDRGQVQEAINLAEKSIEELEPDEEGGTQEQALKRQLDQLRLNQALQTGGAELVQPALPPGEASSPDTKKNVILGLVIGVLLGFGLAVLLERMDRRIRTSEEMEEIYGLPTIGRIPRSKLLARRQSVALGTTTQEGEAFRVLRANLRYFAIERKNRSVLIVSAEEGDGKSTVARGLAMTMTEMGDDVVLVEADLRKGSAFPDPTGKPAFGLSDVLAGEPLDRALVNVPIKGGGTTAGRTLTVLLSGPAPPNPSELLESRRMAEVLETLRGEFQYVILDSPALGAVSDALALVPDVSEIVVVGGLGKTTRDAARGLLQQFTLLEKKPVGVIVNFSEADRGKYSHYYRTNTVNSTTS